MPSMQAKYCLKFNMEAQDKALKMIKLIHLSIQWESSHLSRKIQNSWKPNMLFMISLLGIS